MCSQVTHLQIAMAIGVQSLCLILDHQVGLAPLQLRGLNQLGDSRVNEIGGSLDGKGAIFVKSGVGVFP